MRKRLRAERIRMRLTQTDMAEYLQITQASYSTIERGQRRGREWVWEKLEQLFKTPRDELKENGGTEEKETIRSVGKYV